MKMKKLACVALAGAMTAALAVPAFATPTAVKPVAETTESQFQVELEGMIYTPTIRVQVSESGSVYVNPTGGTVAGTMAKALDGTINLDYSFEDLTVISTPILIRSDTDVALDVSATATATVPKTSGVTLVAKKPATTSTAKEVHLALGGNVDAPLGNSDSLKTTTTDGVTTVGLTADKVGAVSKTDLVPATDGKSASLATAVKVANIGAAAQTKDTAGKVTAVVPQYGAVVVTGDSNPKVSWTESDVVNVSLALTFSIASGD